VMAKLSTYMSEAGGRALPDQVVQETKYHVLDTLAAMISGSELPPGRQALKFARAYGELCGRLGDEVDQAAWWAGISMTSIPFWNLIPWTTFGNWFSPFNRRHVFAAALTSLNTMSLAVFADRAPFVRTVR